MEEDLVKAKRYRRVKEAVFFAGLAANLVALAWMQFSGLSSKLKDLALTVTRQPSAAAALYSACFFCLLFAALLPLDFYSGFALEKRFGLSAQPLGRWVADALKKFTLSLILFTFTATALLTFIDRFPRIWWVVAGLGWLGLTLFLARILPRFIIPLFYRTHPLPAGPLKDAILSLCQRAGVRVIDIYEILFSKKTKKANAALVGIGGSRRVLLADTLLEHFTPAEIEMVVAHELGHHVKKHIGRAFVFNALAVFSGFYLLQAVSGALVAFFGAEGLADLRIFPSLVFLSSAGSLILFPLQNAFSRWQENEADAYALATMPRKDVFVSLMRKLSRQNLSDPDPGRWTEFLLYDHPSTANRIRHAEKILS